MFLIVLYFSMIFIVPSVVDVYFETVERRACEQSRIEAGAQPDPDPQYRLQRR